MNLQNRILLKVGGAHFETTLQTISKYPNSLLARVFASENKSILQKDAQGVVFFDRSAKLFEHVLNFYRTGTIVTYENDSKNAVLQEEFAFWGFDNVLSIVEEALTAEGEQNRAFQRSVLKTRLDKSPVPANAFYFELIGENALSFVQLFSVFSEFTERFYMTFDPSDKCLVASLIDECSIAYLHFKLPVEFFSTISSAAPRQEIYFSSAFMETFKTFVQKSKDKQALRERESEIAIRMFIKADGGMLELLEFDGKDTFEKDIKTLKIASKFKGDDLQHIVINDFLSDCVSYTVDPFDLKDAIFELCKFAEIDTSRQPYLVFESDGSGFCKVQIVYLVQDAKTTQFLLILNKQKKTKHTGDEKEEGKAACSKDDDNDEKQDDENSQKRYSFVQVCVNAKYCSGWFQNMPKHSTKLVLYLKHQFPVAFQVYIKGGATTRFLLSPIYESIE